ncbi:MAG: GTPase Era [Dehalococcoidia bacterium]|jgi:GTP-binding protein Era|nr:GTPase Era [Dehalococcoidia bacterium]MDW8009131.1 GTPase Era [Chloroflexota bacterium]
MAEAKKGRRRKAPFRAGVVAILGRPNVGKSTLLNQLLQFKVSAVAPKPQTTRENIKGILTGPDYQIVLLDTPGYLGRPAHLLDQQMVRLARDALLEADLVVLMVEPLPPGDIEETIMKMLAEERKAAILAINKVDTLRNKAQLLPVMDEYARRHPFREIVPISALKADGVDLLLQLMVRHLPEGDPLYPPDEVTDRSERALAADIVREEVYHLYRQEVPYAVAVAIDEFREQDPEHGGKDYIRALVFVERQGQKGILIGKGGQALKEVGTRARQQLELLLGRPIYLELWVKVRPGWRKDPQFLRWLQETNR